MYKNTKWLDEIVDADTGETLQVGTNQSAANFNNAEGGISDVTAAAQLMYIMTKNTTEKLAAEARRVMQEADYIYPGVDLTVKHAAEIAQYSSPWAWIQARIQAANFADIHIGDYIPFTSSNGYAIQAEIAGIDTYYRYGDAGYTVGHHIDFISRDCWPEAHAWNKANYNNGTSVNPSPFMASDIKAWLNSEQANVPNAATADPALVAVDYRTTGVYDKLPAALQAVIMPKRLQMPIRYTTGVLLTDDTTSAWGDVGRLWLPYEVEIFGRSIFASALSFANSGMQQYARFIANTAARVKGIGPIGDRQHWSLASSRASASSYICCVSFSGNAGLDSGASVPFPVPVCFRIA